jgi:hypothetical protein
MSDSLVRLATALMAVVSLVRSPSAIDTAFTALWNAPSPRDAAQAADRIVKLDVTFDDAYARLKRGRAYSAQAPRGVVHLSHHFDRGDFEYTVDVPETYDPARAYQVRVQLHGGVMGRQDGTVRGAGSIGALAGVEQIYVLPVAWQDAPWWSDAQIENMRAVLDSVKRMYNVDENRVVLSGVSDGATANYYFAMRDTTPFASFLTLTGALAVLQNSSIDIDGELFLQNLVNKPFFMVNGGRDPLYPAALVEPYIDHLKRGGVEVLYHLQPDGVHNTSWWPQEKDAFETFVREHPRKPYPERLTWETDMTAGTNRAHWLVIDRLTAASPVNAANPARPASAVDSPMPDLNDYSAGPLPAFGVHVDGRIVTAVLSGSNADSFGLQRGDIVTGVNGQAAPDDRPLLEWLATFPTDARMTFAVLRRGDTVELPGFFIPGNAPSTYQIFDHRRPSGRVDLDRQGNTIRATTRGVAEFTLLLSPDVIDFSKPVTVIADGRTVFNARVKKSLPILMKWAARDNDRTMLFGAEVDVRLPRIM